MQVVIELDEKLVAEIDAVAKDFNKNRLQYINDSLQKILQQDRRKKNTLKKKSAECIERLTENFPSNPMNLKLKKNRWLRFGRIYEARRCLLA